MTAAELAALPDALWEKYGDGIKNPRAAVPVSDLFFLAIKEAMQAQKKRDAEICMALDVGNVGGIAATVKCANAIRKEQIL